MSDYFGQHITQVEKSSIVQAYVDSLFQLQDLVIAKRHMLRKWIVKYILQHISDIKKILTAGSLVLQKAEVSMLYLLIKLPQCLQVMSTAIGLGIYFSKLKLSEAQSFPFIKVSRLAFY